MCAYADETWSKKLQEQRDGMICDVREADIHWYWNMKAGTRAITMDPCELVFCHYNASGEEMERE